MENCIFSTYGISIMHPPQWRIFFDPKRGFHLEGGFIRIEDYIQRKGAQISMSINWDTVPSEAEVFAKQYCDNIAAQYERQFKKRAYAIPVMELIPFRGVTAAYIESEYRGSQTLFTKKKDQPVSVMQLAYYHEPSGRAVVGSVMGVPEMIQAKKEVLRELLFTLDCTGEKKMPLTEDDGKETHLSLNLIPGLTTRDGEKEAG